MLLITLRAKEQTNYFNLSSASIYPRTLKNAIHYAQYIKLLLSNPISIVFQNNINVINKSPLYGTPITTYRRGMYVSDTSRCRFMWATCAHKQDDRSQVLTVTTCSHLGPVTFGGHSYKVTLTYFFFAFSLILHCLNNTMSCRVNVYTLIFWY